MTAEGISGEGNLGTGGGSRRLLTLKWSVPWVILFAVTLLSDWCEQELLRMCFILGVAVLASVVKRSAALRANLLCAAIASVYPLVALTSKQFTVNPDAMERDTVVAKRSYTKDINYILGLIQTAVPRGEPGGWVSLKKFRQMYSLRTPNTTPKLPQLSEFDTLLLRKPIRNPINWVIGIYPAGETVAEVFIRRRDRSFDIAFR